MFNVRNLAACLHGGRQPLDVALAVALGLLAGFVTGWNLTLAAVLLAVVLINVRTRTFLLAWASGLGGAWLLARLTYRLGQFLLDSTPLGECVAVLGDGPWVALLDWDRYTLVGGACLAALIALPASRLAANLARSRGGHEAAHSGRLRPLGAFGAAGVLIATGVATSHLVSARVERELLSQLTETNGAPAAAGEFHFSLLTGSLRMSDLQLADPRRLDRDRLRIGRVTAQLRAGDLVRGRLNVDTLTLEHLRGDVARRQPAESNEFAPPVIELPSFDETAAAPTRETIELDGYLRNWPALRDRLAACGPWVKALGGLPACDEDTMTARRERSDLGRRRPRVFVAKLHAAGLASSWGLGARATLEVTRLSSRPSGLEGPTRIELVAPECGTEISAEMDPRDESGRIAIKLRSHGLALDDLVDPHQTESLLDVAGGDVRLAGEGWIDGSQLELSVHVEIDSLDARVTGQQTLAGLSAAVWDDGLRRLGALRTEVLLSGSWDSPTVTADRRRVVEQFKHQLRAAGEHQLVKAIEEQLARAETPSAPTESKMADANDAQEAGDDARCPGDDGLCRVSDVNDAPLTRYPYPSTDGNLVDETVMTLPPIDDVAPAPARKPQPTAHGSIDLVQETRTEGAVPTICDLSTPVVFQPDITATGEPESPKTAGPATPPAAPPNEPDQPSGPTTPDPPAETQDKSATLDIRLPAADDAAPTDATTRTGGVSPPVTQPAADDAAPTDATADLAKASEAATVRPARPSAARWRVRGAAEVNSAPAPRWAPKTEPDASTLVEPTLGDDDESTEPDAPEERQNLFSRMSKGIRNRFNRMLPPRRPESIAPDEADLSEPDLGEPDLGEPDLGGSADDKPTVTDASATRSETRKPWFKIFRR
ncbi:MAG TPA: hypothetical protein VMV69_09095 [Pirellulales bacterium]|nr:hypothetical protein [Pirellulales bacterium]